MDQTKNHQNDAATLFYDGRCPLCMKEMAHLAALKTDQLQLADIHMLPDFEGLPDRDTLLRTLHLRMPDGSLLRGTDANVAAWSYTPRARWYRWLRWPLLRPVIDWVYRHWARWRYERLYGDVCAADGEGRCG